QGKESSRAGDLVEDRAYLDKPKGELFPTLFRCIPKKENRSKEPPFHIRVCLTPSVPERVLAVNVVPSKDVEVTAYPFVVMLGRISLTSFKKERSQGSKLNLR